VKSDHAKRLDDLAKEQATDMHKAQLIEVNLSLVHELFTRDVKVVFLIEDRLFKTEH